MPCGVMMASVCINNPDEDINSHLIVDKSVVQEKYGHPYREEFIKYQCFTPWKNAPLSTPKHPFTLKQRLVRVLRALHIIAPRYRKLVKQLK